MRKVLGLLLVTAMAAAMLCSGALAAGEADASLLLPASAAAPLSEDYEPDDLKQISSANEGVRLVTSRSMMLREEALEALYLLMRAAETDGVTLYVRQAYRSYAEEERRYDLLTGMGSEAQKPGESSYQTGLSVTLVGEAWKTQDLTEDFAGSAESRWLSEHAAEYGFVLRYPKGKESVTGWHYEPWHYRYVGVRTAAEMTAQGLCLDELSAVQAGAVIALPQPPEDEPEAADEDAWDEPSDEADFEDDAAADGEDEPDGDAGDSDDSISVGFEADTSLLLPASAEMPLGRNYEPDDLKQISSANEGVRLVTSRSMMLREEALEALYLLMRAAETDGVTLYVRQAYRSYAEEERRYDLLAGMGSEAQKPGESSYQTGLSVTLVGEAWKTRDLTEDFADSAESRWLSEHAAEYGFVLRYPKGKESVTGWHYEPWHYRYVGVRTAAEMTARDLCLDELAARLGLVAEEPVGGDAEEPVSADAEEPVSGDAEEPIDGDAEEPKKPVVRKEHSVPPAIDLSGIAPEDFGPDGDYDISIFGH